MLALLARAADSRSRRLGPFVVRAIGEGVLFVEIRGRVERFFLRRPGRVRNVATGEKKREKKVFCRSSPDVKTVLSITLGFLFRRK